MAIPPVSKLSFPDLNIPAPGTVTAVGPGVMWLRMPLPFDLNHINLYLLEDHDGWFVVDTGLGGNRTQGHWESIFDHCLAGKPVKGIIVTHLHPDHVGQAGFISERWRAPLWMTRTEYFTARALSSAPSEASQWPVQQHYQRSGISPELQQQAVQAEGGFSGFICPLPRAYRRLQHDDRLTINGNNWRVMVGRGHAPEHACLYAEELGLLISGDQILPNITPNISVYSTEPEANPLADYLDSLQQFRALADSTLVLPAHNLPFYGVGHRVQQLIDHHRQKLDTLLAATGKPKSAAELMPALFKRELSPHQTMFALGECLAHLHYLMYRGDLQRELDDRDIYRYRSTRPQAQATTAAVPASATPTRV
ncbi:MBL fold metallo-hydrolase [Exilibacterium tricleocarpae]|nr:MBL fold metallo-hydrolase [Exilibacterium tricleocarpae]